MARLFGTTYDEEEDRRDVALRSRMIGRAVRGVEVSEGESNLRFAFDDGTYVMWSASGDCSSETWFAEVLGVQALIGRTITAVEPLEMPKNDGQARQLLQMPLDDPRYNDDHTRQECDVIYGVEITTDGGRAQVIFRNSSNGYYGGDLEFDAEETGEGYKWEPIIADWAAYA